MSQSERLVGLSKGLQALALFDETRPFLTIQNAAEALDLTRAAARRILLTLTDEGYLIQRDRNFLPSSKVLALGFNYFTAMGLPGLSQPCLDRLSERAGESVGINVLEHGAAILVARAEPRRLIRLDTRVGMATPAYASASGRVLLSDLPEKQLRSYLDHIEIVRWGARTVKDAAELEAAVRRTAEQGWSYASNEARDGLSSLAVPVRLPDGHVVAAVNIFFLMTDHDQQTVTDRFLADLKNTAAEIEGLLRLSAPALHALIAR